MRARAVRARRLRRALATSAAGVAGLLVLWVAAGAPTPTEPAGPAPHRMRVYLTTTSDPGGRQVVQGLRRQPPLTFRPGRGGTLTVDPSRTYQRFEGGGASFTDTAAWLLNSSGALSEATRATVLR